MNSNLELEIAKHVKKLAEDYFQAIRAVDPDISFVVMLAAVGAMIGALMEQWREKGGDPQAWVAVLQKDIQEHMH